MKLSWIVSTDNQIKLETTQCFVRLQTAASWLLDLKYQNDDILYCVESLTYGKMPIQLHTYFESNYMQLFPVKLNSKNLKNVVGLFYQTCFNYNRILLK